MLFEPLHLARPEVYQMVLKNLAMGLLLLMDF
jgi:hypothetical protein